MKENGYFDDGIKWARQSSPETRKENERYYNMNIEEKVDKLVGAKQAPRRRRLTKYKVLGLSLVPGVYTIPMQFEPNGGDE